MDHFYQLVMMSERSIEDWLDAEGQAANGDAQRIRKLSDARSYILTHFRRTGTLVPSSGSDTDR